MLDQKRKTTHKKKRRKLVKLMEKMGKLIELIRNYRGLSQSQLANAIDGLSQGHLSKIEKDLINATPNMLEKIADRLGFPLSFFHLNPIKTPISDFYYKKRTTISRKEQVHLEALIDIYRMVVDILLESIDIPEYDMPSFDIAYSGSPQQIARKLRKYLSLERGPIENLTLEIEKRGVIIVEIDTQIEKFDGITTLTDKRQPIIFINKNMPNDRKRFTIVHELGHLIMHIPFLVSTDRDEEIETNTFTGEFLMPELDCYNDLLNLKISDLPNLKRYWKVSMAAIISRATILRAIASNKSKYLWIELSRRGWRKKEPIIIDYNEPNLVRMVIESFFNDLEYTRKEALDILCLSEKDFGLLFNLKSKVISINKRIQN